MDRYQRVEKPKAETPINENEIRITTQGRMRNYITYATTLLQVLSVKSCLFFQAVDKNGRLMMFKGTVWFCLKKFFFFKTLLLHIVYLLITIFAF